MAKYRSKLPYFVAKKSLEQNGRKITQQQIAEETGLTQGTVSNWMSEKPMDKLAFETAEALARWVGCNWHELVERLPERGEIIRPELMPGAV